MELNATIERVWRAISDPAEIAKWFPDRVADWRLEPGHMGTFTWDNVEGREVSGTVRVEKVEPPTYLAWTWGHESGHPSDHPR